MRDIGPSYGLVPPCCLPIAMSYFLYLTHCEVDMLSTLYTYIFSLSLYASIYVSWSACPACPSLSLSLAPFFVHILMYLSLSLRFSLLLSRSCTPLGVPPDLHLFESSHTHVHLLTHVNQMPAESCLWASDIFTPGVDSLIIATYLFIIRPASRN